jgi:hypothetical protein
MEIRKQRRIHQDIEHEFEGKKHHGSFYVTRGWLVLSTDVGHRSAALNGSPPQTLARMLFEDLIADNARGRA